MRAPDLLRDAVAPAPLSRPFQIPLPATGPLAHALIARRAIPKLERALGVEWLNGIYARCSGAGDVSTFLQHVLDDVQVHFRLPREDLARIPRTGPLVVVSNHPFGALDGIILSAVLLSVRSDVKVMANYLLSGISDLRNLFLCVNPFGGNDAAIANGAPMRHAMRWLKDGGVLAAFPAGEVAHLGWRDRGPGVSDPPWNQTIARIARRAGAPVLPIYFDGRNSLIFHLAGLIHPRLRTALLPRELMRKAGKRIDLRIGKLIPNRRMSAFQSDEDLTAHLRGRTFLLRHAKRQETTTPPPAPIPADAEQATPRDPTAPSPSATPHASSSPQHQYEPVLAPIDPALLAADIANLPDSSRLVEQEDMLVFAARAPRLRHVLQEIGRLREITFREAGEGTGRAIDLDTFDYDYVQLFVWNRSTREVVGGYRLGATDELLPAKGRLGLYTSTLFNYKAEMLRRIDPALEMGRSFVRREYQRSYAPLLLLWKGIGSYIVRQPRYRYLFGPVSISNDYNTVSRTLMVQFLQMHHAMPGGASLVRPRHPFRLRPPRDLAGSLGRALLRGSDDVSDLVAEIEPDEKGIPVLLRQYLKLGAKFVAFNVDPAFSDALDGLIVVDLLNTEPRVLEKYMGRDGYRSFVEARRAHGGVSTAASGNRATPPEPAHAG